MKTRKLFAILLVMALFAGLMAGCGSAPAPGSDADEPDTSADAEPLKVALMLNGTLGDKAFFDSANNGIAMINDQLENVETKVVEATYDDTKWEPALLDLCDGDYDIIICGTWQMQEIVTRIAPDYPDKKFIVYDTSMDYTAGDFSNVYSIEYKQNDGSFLAGVLAASMTKTGTIGFVGGMDNTVIYDFLVGYIQGAQTVKPDIKVQSAFVGDFSNTARAKELALSQYNMGADIIFSCASTAGDGTMQAGKEVGKFVIGVDSDQAMLYNATDPDQANLIPSSVLKRVDMSLFQSIKAAQEGTLQWGTRVALGIAEDCIGLADNEIYQKIVPADTKALISEYSEKIKSGEIKVVSAFDMENQEVLDYVNAVK
jgi:basic membrane protein A